jgi:hypothetical protein
MQKFKIFDQVRRNFVAIISLTVALTGLAYNTWRNEQTEYNRNQRFASFMVLTKLNELQEFVFYRRYDPELEAKGDSIKGWTYVLTIHDLTQVLPEPFRANADKLSVTWDLNWEEIENDPKHADAILAELDKMRDDTISLLNTLE